MGMAMLCQPVPLRRFGGLRRRRQQRFEDPRIKKRPAPEGAGLPGVVPFDIVNWEGNYILDTNTFLIVIPYP